MFKKYSENIFYNYFVSYIIKLRIFYITNFRFIKDLRVFEKIVKLFFKHNIDISIDNIELFDVLKLSIVLKYYDVKDKLKLDPLEYGSLKTKYMLKKLNNKLIIDKNDYNFLLDYIEYFDEWNYESELDNSINLIISIAKKDIIGFKKYYSLEYQDERLMHYLVYKNMDIFILHIFDILINSNNN